nr:copia-type Pol polyprotein [Tanacetum cinerariifolium]
MALADDEIFVGKNHARIGEWINITMKKINILPSMDEDLDWQTYLKYINIDLKENPFTPASLDYDHEMVLKSKDWVERLNSDSKLLKFNIGRILVLEIHVVNECLQHIKAPTDPESLKESGLEPQTPLSPLKNLQTASLSSEVMILTYQYHYPVERSGLDTALVPTKVKINDQESKIDELTKLVQMLIDEKINFNQMIQKSKFMSS